MDTRKNDIRSTERDAGNFSRINRDDEDIHDSERDAQRLQPDEATIELPDVEDIPGQENVTVPPPGEMADTTISSDDEEGEGLFDDDKKNR